MQNAEWKTRRRGAAFSPHSAFIILHSAFSLMLKWLINPWIWYLGPPAEGWSPGLEVFWPILAEGALVSVALGLVGCFLVVRGMSLLGDALSHSVLPGIVIGFLVSARL